MYEKRVVAFLDILGFGALVEESDSSPELANNILLALKSMSPDNLQKEADATLNYDRIPEERVKEAEAVLQVFNEHVRRSYQVDISYFSDCIVLSALVSNVMSKQMLLDIVGKFSINLWAKHKLLVRGGLTIGNLYHEDGGPVFGPAMNRAYYIESKLAKNPRVLIDAECMDEYRQDCTFNVFESMIEVENSSEYYASLSTFYRHYINDSSYAWNQAPIVQTYKEQFFNLNESILERLKAFDNEEIILKYMWMLKDIDKIILDIKP
ncbi:hypothetical protein [Photobacterium phosphoreum]|uniref:hypothetical protein n=1 Tax=Photobacterium phosphoreum TaxID=659 RepID=UPI000D16A2AD|nr:hypothetical protein [Photobacterium phosphoreum]MCD9474358.1 hypothetical protein [Photobacterium phosphoreum]MCF2174895.1 hypothetical protein [Photobacterium phosphoreum]PSU55326.1 hypothetical protein CTM80_20055 [Photobacterium phosphoreum]